MHNSVVVGMREGEVVLELELGWTLAFRGQLYVPILRVSLLSVSSLEDKEYSVEFRGKSLFLWIDWQSVLRIPL